MRAGRLGTSRERRVGTFDPEFGMDFERSYTDLLGVRPPAVADGGSGPGREPELAW